MWHNKVILCGDILLATGCEQPVEDMAGVGHLQLKCYFAVYFMQAAV